MENFEKVIAEIKEAMPGLKLLENENMSEHCSFKIGGPVRVLAIPSDETELSGVCRILKENSITPMMLGNGTNILFPDEGLSDLFMISTERLTSMYLMQDGAIYAQAGVSLAKLSSFAQQNGLKGLEFASGIPGSLGGGVLMNAGAYGGELKDAIESIEFYYLPGQRIYRLENKQCEFSYRMSLFQRIGGCVILSAVIRLEKGDGAEIAARMRELNERRREKQPLDLPSAGSAFKRPTGYFAAALIEEAGLKGYRCGGAQVSEKHAGFVVNAGGAKARDVHELMAHVKEAVYEKSGVILQPEIIMLTPDYKPECSAAAVIRENGKQEA